MYLNLLPPEFRLKLLVRRRLRKWSIVWTVCALALTPPLTLKYARVAESKSRLLLVEGRCKPTRKLEHETRALEDQAALLGRDHHFVQGLDLANRALGLIGELGSSVERSDGKLQLVRLDLRTSWIAAHPDPAAKPAAASTSPPVLSSAVTLHGVSLDDASVAHFMTELRDQELLNELKLKAYSARPTSTGTVRDYQIEGSW